jgi:hypothetical protein
VRFEPTTSAPWQPSSLLLFIMSILNGNYVERTVQITLSTFLLALRLCVWVSTLITFNVKLVMEMEKENKRGADSRRNDIDDNNQEATVEVMEKGDIFFFYRPKTKILDGSGDVKSIEDIRRFFMVTATTAANNENEQHQQFDGTNRKIPRVEESPRYRLFVIGKKSLPEIRATEARRSERYWAKVGGVFENPQELTSELLSDEFRKGDAARPVGEGKYAIVKHQDHAELAYVLEMPEEPGEAQRELGIEKEASYIVSIINPKIPAPAGYPSSEEPPNYPEPILKEFGENENFISLAIDLRFINFQNAQMLLVGAREGRDVIQKEFGIDIEEEKETLYSADIFSKLKIEKDKVPTKPLIEGKFE